MFRQAAGEKERADTIRRIPVGRLGRPEEVAEAVAYFAAEEAGYTTGQVLVVSGGYSAQRHYLGTAVCFGERMKLHGS